MIRRSHQHQCMWVGLGDPHRGGKDRRRGITSFRFNKDSLRSQFNLSQLFCHNKAKRVAGDHDGGSKPVTGQAAGRGLEQTFIPHKLGKLLGVGLARQRPQTCAGTTAEENGMDHEKDLSLNYFNMVLTKTYRPRIVWFLGPGTSYRFLATLASVRSVRASPCRLNVTHPSACASCHRV